jgi:hypothetical protein
MEQIPNLKCGSCKCYWKPDETDIKSSGLYFKTCRKCRERNAKNADKVNERSKKYQLENAEKLKEYKKQYDIENADKLNEYRKQYYLENADKHKEYRKQYYLENTDKLNERSKQYRLENIDKYKEQSRQYRLENIDKIKEQSRQYYLENIDKVKERTKLYQLENPDKIRERKRIYFANMKENNPMRYLAHIQRKQLSNCLKYINENKKGHSIEYLGCSYEDFHKHIETKINNWNTDNPNNLMDFTNIHIDHIKPISRFNFTDEGEELLDCCNYTNLQPLLMIDNLSKNNKWTNENEAYWVENIRGNAEYNKVYL